ncbi:MAG: magnesium transporter [Clostridia bacterium]|nr:magnesium transporter [Clostridia bacterium]
MEQIEEMAKRVTDLLDEKKYHELKELMAELEPADVALIFEESDKARLALLFRILAKEQAAEVFVELGSDMQEMLIYDFSDSELREVLEELYLDDTVDIIEEMPANVVKRILRHSEPGTRQSINELLKYPKYSAGSIMTIEFVDLKKNMTVEDAFTRIRRTGLDKETVYTCYVTDENRVLLGLVSVKDLLLADNSKTLEEIMETNIIYVNTLEDREQAAKIFEKYDFLAIPVVDNENRLVGIITVDDAIDVIQEENTEDIEKMAAIVANDKPYMKTGVFENFKKRIPWLLVLMLSATFTGKIINMFEQSLSACVILTVFIPMLMGTGGNSGGQTSVTVIRGMSLNDIEMRDIFKVIWKEIRVSLLCGITLAVANFIKMMLVDRSDIIASGQDPLSITIVVCITLIVTVFCAKLIGCVLPMLAKKLGFDPAVMASPFITTVVDAISLFVFFNIASLILNI